VREEETESKREELKERERGTFVEKASSKESAG